MGGRWKIASIGTLASMGSYAIALWAMTRAPVALVAAVRETSVLFAAVIGTLLLREPFGWQRAAGTVVEVDHPTRGPYLTVGNPIKLSASPTEVTRSPLLGEHTDEILRDVLGYSAVECLALSRSGAIGAPVGIAAE